MQKRKLLAYIPRSHKNYIKQCSNIKENKNYTNLCKHLNVSEHEAHYLSVKHPVINKMDESKIKLIVDTVCNLGYMKEALINFPSLFGILPQTLKYRYRVLKECGFNNVTPKCLISYLPLVRQKLLVDLKTSGDIPSHINVENRLASYMTQWPTSLTTLISGNVDDFTLYDLRLKIIQRYLELVLDLTRDEFYRGLQTYPTIKHRPLGVLNETLQILQSIVMMPCHKIKSNLYLVHVDPENLKDIIYKFRSIGGIDIKEILRMHPKLATKNYAVLVEIRKILQEYKIDNEAQKRCFDIYTLSPSTVRERLESAKDIPEFKTFENHPRYLKMIHYNNTALKRLHKLYDSNKKCLSLNILSGSSAHYEVYEKSPGDRLGNGKDLLFCTSQSLDNKFSMNEIRRKLKRHPFWINVPLVQVKYVCQKLKNEFSTNEIYENCPVLLYPWNKIRDTLKLLHTKSSGMISPVFENIDFEQLNGSQKLSLIVYILEKTHYFSGNGVWTEEKSRKIDLSNVEDSVAPL